MTTTERQIKCAYCEDGHHPSSSEIRLCAEDHNYQARARTWSNSPPEPKIVTIGDVEELVTQTAPDFGDLLDAIAAARGHNRWDLVDQCATLALASVTGVVPNRDVYYAARQIAVARLQSASFDDLHEVLPSIVSDLQGSPAFLEARSNSAIKSMETELLDLTLLIADERAPSLIASAARLRKLDRPDLAAVASTRAIDRNGTVGVALTVRSAAHLDAEKPDVALADIKEAEDLLPSSYTANVFARLETARGNLNAAEHWAILSNTRDPEGTAGALSMMKIRAIQKRYAEADEWAQKANTNLRVKWSVEWMRLQAANELVRGGKGHDAEVILSDLWQNGGYAPARRRLLELRHPAAA